MLVARLALLLAAVVDAATLSKVERTLELEHNDFEVEKVQLHLHADSEAVSEVELLLPANRVEHLSYQSLKQNGKSLVLQEMEPPALPAEAPAEVVEMYAALPRVYRAALHAPVEKGGSTSLKLHRISTHVLQPKPLHVAQTERQNVAFEGDALFLSSYAVATQSTEIKLRATKNKILSHTEIASKTKVSDRRIRYGAFDDVGGFDVSAARTALLEAVKASAKERSRTVREIKGRLRSEPVHVHAQHDAAFVTFDSAVVEYEVSHWGNVAVTSLIDVSNKGAKLDKGYQRHQAHSMQSIMRHRATKEELREGNEFRLLSTQLPTLANDVWLRDRIGNISSSHLQPTSDVRKKDKGRRFDIFLRYPLFGGWKADLQYGYDTPIEQFVAFDTDSNEYVFRAKFGVPFDAVVDAAEVRVVLPEGATDVRVHTPQSLNPVHTDFTRKFSYLDFLEGRPVVVLTKSNVVSRHAKLADVEIRYRFAQWQMLREPMLLATIFGSLFLAVLAFGRMKLSFSGEKPKLKID
ncbi:MAG: hypothetical protein MHM6MM_006345 [Cercozoa sp. M6MM]